MEEVNGAGHDTPLYISLRSSSTSRRSAELSALQQNIFESALPEAELRNILTLLFSTYPAYNDRTSRREVQNCLRAIFATSSECFSEFVGLLKAESSKTGLAPSSIFVLIEWCSMAIQFCVDNSKARETYLPDLVVADAQLLELNSSLDTRRSVKNSGITVTRRALRKAFKQKDIGDETLSGMIQLLAPKNILGYKNAILLGIIAGVCAHLSGSRETLQKFKSSYYSFWVREVNGSKTTVPQHVAEAFHDFFSNYTTAEDLNVEIVPALEKGLLRAPEVVLSDVIRPMILSLPPDIDLSDILANRLFKALFSNTKSANSDIRNGSVSTFAAVIGRCKDTDQLEQILKEILNPFLTGKIASAEQRVICARMIALFPFHEASSIAICNAMASIAVKEPNEAAAFAEIHTLTIHLAPLLSCTSFQTEIVTGAYLKGLCDKRPAFQKLWAASSGDLLWQVSQLSSNSPLALQIIEAVLPRLLELFNEVSSNPISSAQTGIIVAAYAVTSLWGFFNKCVQSPSLKSAMQKAKVLDQALLFGSKPSFLLNHKVYTKISGERDLIWIVRALSACSSQVCFANKSSGVAEAWIQSLLYLITSSIVPSNAQKNASQALTEAYTKQPIHMSSIVVDGVWTWCRHIEADLKDSAAAAAQTGVKNIYVAIRAICLPNSLRTNAEHEIEPDGLQSQLVNMLVLCCPEILPRVKWIDICLRVGQDPGALVSKRNQQCLNHVNSILNGTRYGPPSAAVRLAAYNTLAELAFVSPKPITTLLVDQIKSDLSVEQLRGYGPTEFAIARTPEGTAFIDVLSKKSENQVLDKSAADYDTLKWEQEIRAQVALKRGQQKKLTPDEQNKVNAQLAKEAVIREQVLSVEKNLQRGIGLAHGLATGPPTDADVWMGPSLTALVNAIQAGVGLLVGDSADKVYIACANFVSSRLGTFRPFIGVATLRALGSSHLPKDFEQEPLKDLVTRTLYRIRLAAEQRPFDSVSLNYMIPLICTVLRRHGVGHMGSDDDDEQVTLALEFLSFHTDAFFNLNLPRGEIIAILIRSMQDYSQYYKLIKDCLLDLCRAMAPNMTADEISVLLKGTIVPQISVRTAVLQAIRANIDLTEIDFSEEIWLASHDDVEENVELGHAIWAENALEVEGKDVLKLITFLSSSDKQLRRAASRSIAACVTLDRAVFVDVLVRLQKEYCEAAKPRVPERDEYGMLKRTDLSDPWEVRSGIALTFKELAPVWEASQLVSFIKFMIRESTVGDRNSSVRDDMIESATAVISMHGGEKLEELMKMFEDELVASGEDSLSDLVSKAVVILYGALARHLRQGDERVPTVVQKLLQTLNTPSETVQYAVAGCLPPLIRSSAEKTSEYIQQVLGQLFQSKKYAGRRGAAYGLAGIVSGKGILALRENRVMSALRSGIENKKDQSYRQGALFAYELLSLILGRTFEPYVIQIVPQLLTSFGDASADVREACLDAAKTCFSSLSSYGVKLILPTLLDGLEESQWRSKKGACDLLGAMAYLDPQQLALSLPDIIPPLTNVLNDSHKEVRSSANRSLQRFGEVISNPEVKGLVGILLKALSDPTKYTDEALDALIKVSFIHYLDSPSLALVVRILERGLGDRSGTKRKSAQIIGSLAHLTERKDLIAHLPILVAGLRLAVVDPVPATRATSSKALGSLVEKLGEDALPDLIPSLMSTLKSETGAGDRLGSAQALSEVLAGLGTGRLEETLPTILQNVASSKPTVREGFMSLFIYLPACFGNSFSTYLNKIVPSILAGLADEVESIRETALRAGRLLVKNFATKAIDLLLPELDRGLSDDSYRIRLSSVELVGDLLFNLTGISGNADQDDNDSGAAEAGQSLLEVLGEDKRNRILSSLYICRSDTSGLVRSAAVNVWKALVATPKTLKELIPTLTQLLIRRLASSNPEQKVIAGNALGELIRKAGDGVLATLLPTLEDGLHASTDNDSKQGICIALREIISSASPEILEEYEKTLISVVRAALVDADDDVRDAAADAFDSLQHIFGKRAVDQVLPYLLNLLRTEGEADTALSALLTLLTDNMRSNIILPNLIPTLLTSPISAFNAKAMASLSEVAGTAMVRRLPVILNTLMDNIVDCQDEELRGDLEVSFDTILSSVDEFDGLNTAMSAMLALMKHDDHRRRSNANIRLSKFFTISGVDSSRYNQDLIRVLLLSFDDRDLDVVKAAWTALSELMRRLRKEEMESLVISTRQTLQQVGVAGSNLPGFSLPKGISAILPIFLHGLMNGTAEQRTQSALAISDIVDRTSADALKPFVTNITGPLIRVVSERSVDLKCAILFTLNNLLEKIPIFLKPFLPQLQRTFAKSLADTTSDLLRSRAAKALGTLLTLKPRVDPLIAELVTGTKTADGGVRNAMLKALYEVVSKAGENMSETSRNSVLSLIDSDTGEGEDSAAITYARLLGALIKNLPPTDANPLIKHRALTTRYTYASILGLNAILLDSPTSLTTSFATETPSTILRAIPHKNPAIADNAILAAGKYLLAAGPALSYEVGKPFFDALATACAPGKPVDTRRLTLVVIRTVSRLHSAAMRPHLALLAPPVFAGVRDMVIPVKLAAEAAFLALFAVVETNEVVFEKYMAGDGALLPPAAKKSMHDYFKRVALRLAAQARERREAEGGAGALGLADDEGEDEREIWSVGKVDLGEGVGEE